MGGLGRSCASPFGSLRVLSAPLLQLLCGFGRSAAEAQSKEFDRPVVVVGPFIFDKAVLDWGNQVLLDGLATKPDLVVIDEVG